MIKYFVLMLLLSSPFLFSQENRSVPTATKKLNDTEFLKAKEDYLKMTLSATYIELEQVTRKLASKIGILPGVEILESDEQFSEWMAANLAKTKFQTVEEPIQLRKSYIELQLKIAKEYAEVYELLSRASQEQVLEIIRPSLYKG